MPHPARTVRPELRHVARGDGVVLALDVWAERGRPVLFAHGFGQTRGAWAESARRLAAAGYQPWTLDARGHGDSGRNPADRGYRMARGIPSRGHPAQPRARLPDAGGR